MTVAREVCGSLSTTACHDMGHLRYPRAYRELLVLHGQQAHSVFKSYCDLQEYCERALDRYDEGNQMGLGPFAEMIGVEFSEEEQHRAAADAYLSLKNLKKVMGGYPLEKCILKADCEDFTTACSLKISL